MKSEEELDAERAYDAVKGLMIANEAQWVDYRDVMRMLMQFHGWDSARAASALMAAEKNRSVRHTNEGYHALGGLWKPRDLFGDLTSGNLPEE